MSKEKSHSAAGALPSDTTQYVVVERNPPVYLYIISQAETNVNMQRRKNAENNERKLQFKSYAAEQFDEGH